MGAREGRRRAETAKKRASPLLLLAAILGGSMVLGVAWFLLVRAAIDFGATARDSGGSAWAFLTVATLGAIACLALMLLVLGRGLGLLGAGAERSGGGHGSRRPRWRRLRRRSRRRSDPQQAEETLEPGDRAERVPPNPGTLEPLV